MFYKGDNFWDFPLAFLHTKPHPLNGKNLLQMGSKFFPFRVNSFFKWDNTILNELPPPERVSIPLKKKVCHCYIKSRNKVGKTRILLNITLYTFPYYDRLRSLLCLSQYLTLVLLNPDIPFFCKQWKSRSFGFWTDLNLQFVIQSIKFYP